MTAFLQFSPFFPLWVHVALAVLGAGLLLLAWRRGQPEWRWRGVLALGLSLLLLNPVLTREARQPLPDKVIVAIDESPSQKIGRRAEMSEKALQRIQAQLAEIKGVEPVVLRLDGGKGGEGTRLFTALADKMAGLPLSQVAGTILITDGQVHDVPAKMDALEKLAPFHVLLTGSRHEFDRRLSVVSAPKYAVLGDRVKVTVRLDVYGGDGAAEAVPLAVFHDGAAVETRDIRPGQAADFLFDVDHPGQSVFAFKVPAAEGELTAANNAAAVIVQGIRNRLRVLLVSNAPHMGERAWRNLLKSDPSIDLVHFTILRTPASMDPTPTDEMSLIAFPVEELFQRKLRDFDLVIFDRYRQYDLLMPHYFTNIARYVRDGGAFLMALDTASPDRALYGTDIGALLPVAPAGQDILRQNFTPQRTAAGLAHPVTADLPPESDWGKWYAMDDVQARSGDVLLQGARAKPLLVLDKVGKGRVAVLASDNIWLWSKGADETVGPYRDLLRNLSHWLMKEPELDDDYMKASVQGDKISLSQRDRSAGEKSLQMTAPSGREETLSWSAPENGWRKAVVQAEETGVYAFASGARKVFAVVGSADDPEFTDVHATVEKLKPVVALRRGAEIWLDETPGFMLRRIGKHASRTGGEDWIGLVRNGAYTVGRTEQGPLLPEGLSMALLLGLCLLVWWREGRRG
jgi:hypothetical protein